VSSISVKGYNYYNEFVKDELPDSSFWSATNFPGQQ
jgi:hypothetical protein